MDALGEARHSTIREGGREGGRDCIHLYMPFLHSDDGRVVDA